MPTRLDKLSIDEISFVDKGANPGARVSIFKAAELEKNRGQMRLQGLGPMDNETPLLTFDSFDSAVDHYQDSAKVPRHVAMQTARRRHPDLYEKYQYEGRDLIAKATLRPVEKSDAVRKFEGLVDTIQSRDDCSRTEAMQRVREAYPEAFREFQNI